MFAYKDSRIGHSTGEKRMALTQIKMLERQMSHNFGPDKTHPKSSISDLKSSKLLFEKSVFSIKIQMV